MRGRGTEASQRSFRVHRSHHLPMLCRAIAYSFARAAIVLGPHGSRRRYAPPHHEGLDFAAEKVLILRDRRRRSSPDDAPHRLEKDGREKTACPSFFVICDTPALLWEGLEIAATF